MSLSAATQAMVDGLAFLREHGFTLLRANDTHSEASGLICAVEYTAEGACRTVAMTYFPGRQTARTSISATDDEFTFADAGCMAIPGPSFADVPDDGLGRLHNYLQAIQYQLTSRYLDILRGGAFQNDAFDWSPYK